MTNPKGRPQSLTKATPAPWGQLLYNSQSIVVTARSHSQSENPSPQQQAVAIKTHCKRRAHTQGTPLECPAQVPRGQRARQEGGRDQRVQTGSYKNSYGGVMSIIGNIVSITTMCGIGGTDLLGNHYIRHVTV